MKTTHVWLFPPTFMGATFIFTSNQENYKLHVCVSFFFLFALWYFLIKFYLWVAYKKKLCRQNMGNDNETRTFHGRNELNRGVRQPVEINGLLRLSKIWKTYRTKNVREGALQTWTVNTRNLKIMHLKKKIKRRQNSALRHQYSAVQVVFPLSVHTAQS